MSSQPSKRATTSNSDDENEQKTAALPSGFSRIKQDNFKKLLDLVTEIKELLSIHPASHTTSQTTDAGVGAPAGDISGPATEAHAGGGGVNDVTTTVTDSQPGETITSSGDGHNRPIEMLVTDVKYIKKYVDSLESSPNGMRADVLLNHLMDAVDATPRRKATDFPRDSVNLKKLLQIVAKLKLWVPPDREGDGLASGTAAKKEESPFVSSKEKEIAAAEIVKELFGLRCGQWGLDGLLKSYRELTATVKNCLLCFSVFQCDVDKDKETGVLVQKSLVIKRRILILWWIAEGLIDLHCKDPDPISELTPQDAQNHNPSPNSPPSTSSNPIPDPNQLSQSQVKKTVEKIGEDILKILAVKGFIEPVIKKGHESGSYQMHPFVHSFVTALAKRAGFFDFSDINGKLTPGFGLSQRACLVKSQDKLSSCQLWAKYTDDRNKLKRFAMVQTLFNVNESIVDIKPEWFSKMKNLSVLHLGSWRSDPVEHIEVEDQKFLEDLKIMKQLRLFSLQGLSTIMKLTESICELNNLVILDLRECHNLEELPSGIGSLQNLTHLDITNCHLLTKLPKGISLLSKLEVLKGFVIYDQAGDQETGKPCVLTHWWKKAKRCVVHDVFRFKNRDVCTLKDLARLQKLRELSLVVNMGDFPNEAKGEVQVFKEMRSLYKLKISWEKSFQDEVGAANQGGEPSKRCGRCFPCIKKPAVNESTSTGDVRGEQVPSSSKCLSLNCCKSESNENGAQTSYEHLDHIKKLELWCYPHENAPSWLAPSQLQNLEKLYIKGGNLKELLPEHTNEKIWMNIKILRLKYLPKMKILWLDLKAMFPNMTYLEKYECVNLPFFPCDQEGIWQKPPKQLPRLSSM